MGMPAARATDMHVCPMVTVLVPHVGGPILPPCCTTVLTGSLPQARVTDMATCVGPPDVIVLGSFTVLVGGLPAARMGDLTAHGGTIVLGLPTVLIGEALRHHCLLASRGVICKTRTLHAVVIPAKAGIHPASLWKCPAHGLDSRFRGNDRHFARDDVPNDPTTLPAQILVSNSRKW
jgi:uncharacterized Zn-binding protein involved in type VI secretion